MGALTILYELIVSASLQTTKLMPNIAPIISKVIWDMKADVKKMTCKLLKKATALVSNRDIECFTPTLIQSLINLVEEVPKTFQLLSATTFISEADLATLSLMVPCSLVVSQELTAMKCKVAV
jgi:elongation factor 3